MLKTFNHRCCIAVDLTESTKELYKQPDEDKYKQKLQTISEILDVFLKDYFDETKIRNALISTLYDGIVEKKTGFISTYQEYKNKFSLPKEKQSGIFSLYNAIKTLTTVLSQFKNTTKEIIFFLSSERTIDKKNIYEELQKTIDEKIHVSIITIGNSIELFQNISRITKGSFICFKGFSKKKFKKIFRENYILTEYNTSQQKIGFPIYCNSKMVCVCHGNFTFVYRCPFCFSPICSLPQNCFTCGNFLSLFIFQKEKKKKNDFLLTEENFCFGCSFKEKGFFCKCENFFCFDCTKAIKNGITYCPECYK